MKKSILLFLFSLVAFSGLAQEEMEPVDTAYSEKRELERELKEEKTTIKNSGYFSSLDFCVALRRENDSLCKSEDCREDFQNLLPFRYMAEGRCREIEDDSQRDLCSALKTGNCQSLPEPLDAFCRGMVNKDINSLINIGGSRAFYNKTGGKISREDVVGMLGVYYGFKNYSVITCERFLGGKDMPLGMQLSCPIMFSQSPSETMEGIAEDLAFFSLSRKKNNPDLCESISNDLIRSKCRDMKIRDFSDMW